MSTRTRDLCIEDSSTNTPSSLPTLARRTLAFHFSNTAEVSFHFNHIALLSCADMCNQVHTWRIHRYLVSSFPFNGQVFIENFAFRRSTASTRVRIFHVIIFFLSCLRKMFSMSFSYRYQHF